MIPRNAVQGRGPVDQNRPLISRTYPPITRHLLALYCGASGDTNPIHVDMDVARRAGFPDVFAHGMLVMAFLGNMLEEAGPIQGLKSFSGRFVSITQLGAQITCEGDVAENRGDEAILNLIAKDQCGDIKVQGTATVNRSMWGVRFAQT